MSNKHIEARLERSLRNQVKAPRLAKRFDAAVWSRIEAQTATTPAPAPRASSWMFAINCIGIGVACVLMAVFGLQSLSGVEANVALPAVTVAPATIDRIVQIAVQAVSVVAIVFGLMFTSTGRRLRQELRGFF